MSVAVPGAGAGVEVCGVVWVSPGFFSAGAAAGSPVLAAGAVVVSAALAAGSPLTTDRSPLKESIHNPRDVTMNKTALIVVIFDRMVAVPRGPKAVWLPTPPKAPARSAAFPDWRSTATIRIKQIKTWMMVINALTFLP